jgi:hypothetical protein
MTETFPYRADGFRILALEKHTLGALFCLYQPGPNTQLAGFCKPVPGAVLREPGACSARRA